jgi:esterase
LKLFHREYGKGKPLIIAHGLFGMSDNWIEIAKAFEDHFKVYLLDLRNHGHSPHDPIHTYDAMSEDILEFLTDRDIQNACFIGHSMGGKLMLNFAGMFPEYIHKLIVVDSSHRAYAVHDQMDGQNGSHRQIIDLMLAINHGHFIKRSEINDFFNLNVKDEFMKQIIQKNIHKDESGTYTIVGNLKEIGKEINLLESMKFLNMMFVFGSESPYYRKEDEIEIREKLPYAQLKMIQHAGHIVHIDNKQAFIKVCKSFLLNAKP